MLNKKGIFSVGTAFYALKVSLVLMTTQRELNMDIVKISCEYYISLTREIYKYFYVSYIF